MTEIVPLADEAARRLARERFDVPVLLEAGAGTGKTRALVERLLSWTLDAGWRECEERLGRRARERGGSAPGPEAIAADLLDGVVAITFTEAAAAEMATRLATALNDVAALRTPRDGPEVVASVGTETAALRAATLLQRLARARIQTIHAFCRGLLADHPFEARLHPSFRVDAEERELVRIATETVTDQLNARLAGAGDPELLTLLDEGIGPESILDAVLEATRTGVEASLFESDPFSGSAVDAALVAAAAAGHALLEAILPLLPGLPANQTRARELGRALSDLLESFDPGLAARARLDAAAPAIEAFLRGHGDVLRQWADGKSILTLEKRRTAGGEPLPRLAHEALRSLEELRGASPARLAVRRRLVAPLLAATRERLRREGFVLYGDLLDRATALLAGHAGVRDAVRRGIRQLLVDEFQDTDRRQCALVERLALVDGGASRPGLFVVGDPKQSIYAWRGADLAAYERFLRLAESAGGVRARLVVNFRSIPALLEEVERVLTEAMVAEPLLQPAFESLAASPGGVERGHRLRGRAAVEYWSSTAGAGARTPLAVASRLEGWAAARDLRRQRELDPSLRWSDFALLLRATGDLDVYLQALREAGVPFAVERDRSYWRRREVIDANAAVRAVLEPGDHLALVAFLRSPFVGVPDAAWLPLWEQGFPARVDALSGPDPGSLAELDALLARVARGIEGTVPGLARIAGWEASAGLALEALGELRAAFGTEPAEDWVERLRARLAPEATAAGRFLGRFGVANLARFFRELTGALETGGDDPVAVVRALRAAIAERRDSEEARPSEVEGDAVRVMTIHRAKGLEFRQVYLLQLHKGQGSHEERGFAIEPADGDRPAAYRLLGARTLGWSAVEERREAIADRERVRLLYVAMTRAQDRLVLAGQLHAGRSRGSFLPLLEARRRLSPAADSPVAAPASDPHGALWRTPALEPDEGLGPPPSIAAAALATDASIEIQRLDQLSKRREDARARAARARVDRASETASALAELVEDEASSEAAGAAGRDAERARRRGLVLHRALELAPLATREPDRWRELARRAWGAGAESEAAAIDADLDALVGSALWRRLLGLDAAVVARELPLLARAEERDEPGSALEGTVGTLDLLYRDPETREWVVADYKTDPLVRPVEGDRLGRYAAQLRLYGRAVRAACGLEVAPRLEIWWLEEDRVEVVG